MEFPAALDNAIRAASEAVRSHPTRVLRPRYRVAIGAVMGPWDPLAEPSTHEGRRRRVMLALASARRALPLWEERWPDESAPHEAIAAAKRLLAVSRDPDSSYAVVDHCAEGVERARAEEPVRSMAGQSAVLALVSSIEDDYVGPQSDMDFWLDGQEGGGDDDSASAASIVWSGGSTTAPGADPAKRLEFWEWWLTEAVPTAYREGSLDASARFPDRDRTTR